MPPSSDQNPVVQRKAAATAWFESLRDQICAAFEAIEDDLSGTFSNRPAGRFERTAWKRPDEAGADGGQQNAANEAH